MDDAFLTLLLGIHHPSVATGYGGTIVVASGIREHLQMLAPLQL